MHQSTASLVAAMVLGACATAAQSPLLHQTFAPAPACVAAAPLDTLVRDTTQVASKPQLREYPDLHYPDQARSEGRSGEVSVFAIIGSDGLAEPGSIRAIGGMDPDLNREAARFVGAARYWPGCLEGHPVRVRVRLPVAFRVTGR